MGKGASETLLGVSLTIFSILALPILLIHGYSEDSHVWDSWLKWLKADNIPATAITFHQHNDKCGTVAEHAAELNKLIQSKSKVNIIAHSKGGLDARWYIAHTSSDKVANLIMIATPNAGTTAAYIDLTSCAFVSSAGLGDLQPGSKATQTTDNNNQTHYFTIAGNYASPCYFVIERICNVVDSDGLVTVASTIGKSNYPLLGVFAYNHTGLLTHRDVYQKVLPIIRN